MPDFRWGFLPSRNAGNKGAVARNPLRVQNPTGRGRIERTRRKVGDKAVPSNQSQTIVPAFRGFLRIPIEDEHRPTIAPQAGGHTSCPSPQEAPDKLCCGVVRREFEIQRRSENAQVGNARSICQATPGFLEIVSNHLWLKFYVPPLHSRNAGQPSHYPPANQRAICGKA